MADSKSETKTTKVRYECPGASCTSTRFHRNEFGEFDDKGKFVVEYVYRCLICHKQFSAEEAVRKEVL